jgi:hypothetical protein
MATEIDAIDLTDEEMDCLDPLHGISEDSKSPDHGTLTVTGLHFVKGKPGTDNGGKLSIKLECSITVEGRSEPITGQAADMWYTIRPPSGSAIADRDNRNNSNFVKIFGEPAGLDKRPTPRDVVQAWNSGGFAALADGKVEIPVEVSRWSGGLNVYAPRT